MLRPIRGGNTSVPSLVGVAILVGILVGFGLSTVGYGVKFQFLSQSLPGQTTLGEEVLWYHDSPPYSPQSLVEPLEYISDMVSKTNGFYARDYSLWLGWNNVRNPESHRRYTHHHERCAILSKQQSFMAEY